MPRYVDVHKHVHGVTKVAVAEAHKKDLEVQGNYGVNYVKHWVDEKSEKVFCLVDSPNKDVAERVHREAHGLVADELNEVLEG